MLILQVATVAGQDLPLTEPRRGLLEAAGSGEADSSAIIRAFDRTTAK